jgi:hypothetical protein
MLRDPAQPCMASSAVPPHNHHVQHAQASETQIDTTIGTECTSFHSSCRTLRWHVWRFLQTQRKYNCHTDCSLRGSHGRVLRYSDYFNSMAETVIQSHAHRRATWASRPYHYRRRCQYVLNIHELLWRHTLTLYTKTQSERQRPLYAPWARMALRSC